MLDNYSDLNLNSIVQYEIFRTVTSHEQKPKATSKKKGGWYLKSVWLLEVNDTVHLIRLVLCFAWRYNDHIKRQQVLSISTITTWTPTNYRPIQTKYGWKIEASVFFLNAWLFRLTQVGAFRVHETVIILPYCLFNEFVVLKVVIDTVAIHLFIHHEIESSYTT